VFQDHKLLMDRPVYDNRRPAARDRRRARRRRSASGARALDQVGLLGRDRTGQIELSTGRSSSVSASRARSSPSRRWLIADEPTGNLDPDLSLEIMNISSGSRSRRHGVDREPRREPDERYGVRRVILEAGVPSPSPTRCPTSPPSIADRS